MTGLREEYGEEYDEASGDVWNILIDKAEAEAYDKSKMVPMGEGVVAYGVLRPGSQTRPAWVWRSRPGWSRTRPPKREEELAEHVEMWQDKLRRLEAHRDEFKLAPVFRINALRTLMIGKSKGCFDLWEADKDHTDPSKSYEELLTNVKDHSRKRKSDSSAKEKMQRGEDLLDVGAVGGWSWDDDTGGGYDQGDGDYAFGFKGKCKFKGYSKKLRIARA